MAEARLKNRRFQDVWESYECEDDMTEIVEDCVIAGYESEQIPAIIDAATERAAEMIGNPANWRAVLELARSLPRDGRQEGAQAAAIISRALRAL
jgi:hypothetical protein